MRGEDEVARRLVERGYRILERNVRQRFGEIDIVAVEGETLVFVEVRTRQSTRWGHPAETVSATKQHHIRRAAEAYLARHRISNREVRFDVATLVWDSNTFELFTNAF